MQVPLPGPRQSSAA